MSADFSKVANKADVPVGQVKVYTIAGKRIAVCNVEGKFFAVADLCTHDGGPLGEGELIENTIECPRHGARFDVATGAVVCMPAVVPIATYLCEVREDDLWIGVPASATK
ncbi:MAG: non-heme iron oxygenase ferredoxin subunit [Candidatus Melainabacteria bacterium]|nr:non-heme iron oxygenase ferredoxin subunit [Candidatus Melainabacteria bacterium]